MKSLCLFVAFIFQCTVYAVSSTEQIQYIPKHDIPFSDIGKSTTYKGVILLEDSTQYEIYELTPQKSLKVNLVMCQKITNELFGNKLKVSIKILAGHTGSICTFEYYNPIKVRTPAYTFGIIGFIRAQPIVIVTGSRNVPTLDEKIKSLKFWQTLR